MANYIVKKKILRVILYRQYCHLSFVRFVCLLIVIIILFFCAFCIHFIGTGTNRNPKNVKGSDPELKNIYYFYSYDYIVHIAPIGANCDKIV